jgi:hypothetical protein
VFGIGSAVDDALGVRELRVILESVEAKKHERVWLKNQSSGDLDDTKM